MFLNFSCVWRCVNFNLAFDMCKQTIYYLQYICHVLYYLQYTVFAIRSNWHMIQHDTSHPIDWCLFHRSKCGCHFGYCSLSSHRDWISCHPCPNNGPSFKVTYSFSFCHLDRKSESTGSAQHFYTWCHRAWLDVNCLIVPCSAPVEAFVIILHLFSQVFLFVTIHMLDRVCQYIYI